MINIVNKERTIKSCYCRLWFYLGKSLQGLEECWAKAVALCDKNSSLARYRAEEWHVPHWYDDVSRMVEVEELDVASICTPPMSG